MELRLIKQLQEIKLCEEDLFPNAAPEEISRRGEERATQLLALYNSIQIKDLVRVKSETEGTTSKGRIGRVVSKEFPSESALGMEVLVSFGHKFYHKPEWFAISDLEKVKE